VITVKPDFTGLKGPYRWGEVKKKGWQRLVFLPWLPSLSLVEQISRKPFIYSQTFKFSGNGSYSILDHKP
jgi:hypothetical protein